MRTPFDTLVRRHGATVLRVCRAVVGPDEADDAWSETFLAALRAYPELPQDANHEAWLVRIAHRKSLDLIRRAQTRRKLAAEVAAQRPAPAADPHDHLAADIAGLPLRQRQAVAYHYLAGLPHAEVAALVDCSPAAARKAASEGIANLRRQLKESQ